MANRATFVVDKEGKSPISRRAIAQSTRPGQRRLAAGPRTKRLNRAYPGLISVSSSRSTLPHFPHTSEPSVGHKDGDRIAPRAGRRRIGGLGKRIGRHDPGERAARRRCQGSKVVPHSAQTWLCNSWECSCKTRRPNHRSGTNGEFPGKH